jgi:hypothetical protein
VGPTAVIINGTTVYSKERVNWDVKEFPAAKGQMTGTITVPHDLQGTKSISVNLKTAIYVGTTTTKADSWTLDPIARASTFSTVEADYIGKSVLVNISSTNSTFTHQLWYKVGTSPWYDLGTGIGLEKLFTIDIATANYVRTSMTGTMQLCLRTFQGTTQIGADVYKNVTVSVPDYTPTISDIALTGNALCNGAYVENKSTVSVGAHASTSYGATLTYTATLDGKTYTGIPFTSSPLSAGSKKVWVTVKDSRGKTATLSSSAFTVYEYNPPNILRFTVERQSDGTTVIAHLTARISSLGAKNTKSLSVTLNGQTQTPSSQLYNFDGTLTFTDVPTDSTLTATAKIADYYTSVSKEAILPTVAVTMDFHYSGTGIAMGKVAEHEKLFEVAPDWDIKYKGEIINDFVVEQGTSGIWTYRKWASGVAECWGIRTVNEAKIDQAWESLYYGACPAPLSYPVSFIEKPVETATVTCNDMWTWQATITGNTVSQTARYVLMRPSKADTTTYTVYMQYRVIGKWK